MGRKRIHFDKLTTVMVDEEILESLAVLRLAYRISNRTAMTKYAKPALRKAAVRAQKHLEKRFEKEGEPCPQSTSKG